MQRLKGNLARSCRWPDWGSVLLAGASLALGLALGVRAQEGTGSGLGGKVVIAHRGASGYLPEHTLPAYTLAYAMGVDFIEPDLVMTRDEALIALHDIHLEATTDVEEIFPERARSDGSWYASDFSLDEIRQLSVHERAGQGGGAAFPERFRLDSKGFRVPTLAEIVELVQELNRLSGCLVGLYIETKEPAFHEREGLSILETLVAELDRFGYRSAQDPVIIQSFEPESLKTLRRELGTRLRLVQLISGSESSDVLVSDPGLREIASYADGIGPAKERVASTRALGARSLVARAHGMGLMVHPYTFRADDLGEGYPDLESEVGRFLWEDGVDGVFSDHPDRVAALVARREGRAPRGLLSCRGG